MAPQRYWCPECRRGYAATGECSIHPDEPLQDLAVPEVRLLLEEQDDAGKQRHAAILIGAVALVAVFVVTCVMLIVDKYDLGEYVNLIEVLCVVAFGLYAGAFALFKYQRSAPQLSDEEIASLDALPR